MTVSLKNIRQAAEALKGRVVQTSAHDPRPFLRSLELKYDSNSRTTNSRLLSRTEALW